METLRPGDRFTRERAAGWALLAIIVVGSALRVAHLGTRHFHVDEALFSSYGLLIATGQDFLLQSEPVDKPPLFFYILGATFRAFGNSETAAALPSLVASVVSIWLAYHLCRRLYGPGTGLAAAALMAASPFNVAYSYTAFIDPTMVGLTLLALALAERGEFLGAGFVAGLLPALKAQGMLFWPAIGLVTILALARERASLGRWAKSLALGLVGVAVPLLIMALWNAARPQQRSFLDLANAHNPLLPADPGSYATRLDEWWRSSLQFIAGADLLNLLLLAGLPLLLVWDLATLARGRQGRLAGAADWGLFAFCVFFVGWHTYFNLDTWDRYMVGLVPFGLILLARVLALPWRALALAMPKAAATPRAVWGLGTGLALALALLLASPVHAGLRSTYHLGWSGSGGPTTYQGLPAAINYLKANAPYGAKLYDYKSLSWHYKYYLFGQPFKVVWFDETYLDSFRYNVLTDPGTDKLLVLPSWEDDEETRRLLEADAVRLTPVYRTYRDDASLSFTIYKVESAR